MKKKLLLLALLGAFASPAFSQNILTGNECWQTSATTSSTGSVCVSQIRGSTANLTLSTAPVNFTISGVIANGGNLIVLAQPAAITITMPPNPITDGAIVGVCNGTNAAWVTNVITVAANSGQTMVPTGAAVTLTTLAAASCVKYQWNLAGASWYKVQ